MAQTIVGPVPVPLPFPAESALVEIKAEWADDWLPAPELYPESMSVATAGHGLGTCSLVGRYGTVKSVWSSSFSTKASERLTGYWVRVRLLGGSSSGQVAWQGKIHGEERTINGSSPSPSGKQRWQAFEGRHELDRVSVHQSRWEALAGAALTIGFVPCFNARDELHELVGNRSSAVGPQGVYLFGGTDVWTRRQALEYLLAYHAPSGPTWTLGGQVELLEDGSDTIPMGETQTLAESISKLAPRQMGLDWCALPTTEGFELRIFSLLPEGVAAAGVTLPGNPATVRVQAGEAINLSVQVARDLANVYDKIRIVGDQTVICCSLWGENLQAIRDVSGFSMSEPVTGALTPKWTSSEESDYLGATAAPPPPNSAYLTVVASDPLLAAQNDKVRQHDRFRSVFQHYGAPLDWNRAGHGCAPLFDANGELASVGGESYQLARRATLPWTPLRKGFDYSVVPATDANATGHEPDLLEPAAWVFDREQGRWFQVEHEGVSVKNLHHEWGLELKPRVNHTLASSKTLTAASEYEARWDFRDLVITFAFKAESRLELVAEPGLAGDGSEIVIHLAGAQVWYLAPNTIVGASQNVLLLSGEAGRVLRNDASRHSLRLAGAVARYGLPRSRADVSIKGLSPWGNLLGHLLEAVEEQGDTSDVSGPITEVAWNFPDQGGVGETRVRAGYAFA